MVTSRVEGIHRVLKEYLKRSDLDLFEVWKAIKLAIINQLIELKANQAKQQIRTLLELSKPLYGLVYGWISYEALRKVEDQRKRLVNPLPSCTKTFTSSHGLPCAHILQDLQGQPLQLSYFHIHWHLQLPTISRPPILIELRQQIDPVTSSTRTIST